MKNRNLKIAIIASGMTHQELAWRANHELGAAESLSELRITKLVTGRAKASPGQRAILAQLLGQHPDELFPEQGDLC